MRINGANFGKTIDDSATVCFSRSTIWLKVVKIVQFYHICKNTAQHTISFNHTEQLTTIHPICGIHFGWVTKTVIAIHSMFVFRLSIFHDLRMGINISSKNVMRFVCHSMCITVTFNNFNILSICFNSFLTNSYFANGIRNGKSVMKMIDMKYCIDYIVQNNLVKVVKE